MLGAICLFLAEVPGNIDLKGTPVPSTSTGYLRDILLISGVAVVLALSLFLYVYMTRRNRRTHSLTGSRAIYRAEKRAEPEDSEGGHRVRRKRRRKEEFERRNPTLGETGGLPPIRTEEPAEPAS